MSGYHILGGLVPPYQVVQQQNAGIPPGGVPPWYAMQYPAGFVPPLLVSVDNPLEEDPFSTFDRPPARGEREEAGLARSHLVGEEYYVSENIDDVARLANVQVTGAESSIASSTYVRDKVAALDADIAPLNLSYEAARKLAKRAIGWTQRAETAIKTHSETLFGPATYETPRGHVQWHLDYIEKKPLNLDLVRTPYEKSDDLKKWVSACYRIMVAADQDSALRDSIRDELRADLLDAVVAAPGRAAGWVAEAPGKVVESATGLPLWAWTAIALGGTAILGYGVFRILLAAAPVATPALVGATVRRYI